MGHLEAPMNDMRKYVLSKIYIIVMSKTDTGIVGPGLTKGALHGSLTSSGDLAACKPLQRRFCFQFRL